MFQPQLLPFIKLVKSLKPLPIQNLTLNLLYWTSYTCVCVNIYVYKYIYIIHILYTHTHTHTHTYIHIWRKRERQMPNNLLKSKTGIKIQMLPYPIQTILCYHFFLIQATWGTHWDRPWLPITLCPPVSHFLPTSFKSFFLMFIYLF